jgi:nucleoside-diphosphate-sugar epimerase
LKSLQDARILITGASGWLGRETLCLLQREVGSLNGLNLTLSGSVEKSLDIHGESVKIVRTDDAIQVEAFDLILHFAFITQEKALSMGENAYADANIKLNESAVEIAQSSPHARQLVLSSGAAKLYLDKQLDSQSKSLYAKLKLDLEEKIQDERTLTLRLWNTSGHHLGINPNYAISEFICSAKKNQSIDIRNNLKRSYIYSQDVIRASIQFLSEGGSGIVNSGGVITDLSNLATQIVRIHGSKSEISLAENSKQSGLDYLSPISEIPEKYWRQELNLEQQIVETSAGIDF